MAWYGVALVTASFLVALYSVWRQRRAERRAEERERLARETRMRVVMERVLVPRVGCEVLLVTAANESDFPVRALSVEIEQVTPGLAGFGRLTNPIVPGASLPGVIEPRDQGETTYMFRGTDGSLSFAANTSIRARVTTPAGPFYSEWEPVSSMTMRTEPRPDLPVPPGAS